MSPPPLLALSSILLLIIFLSASPSPASSLCDEGDKRVLLKIKAAFVNSQSLASWDPNTDCCSSWVDVRCRSNDDEDDTGRVMRVILSSGDLSGPIPPYFGDLPMLEDLFINDHPNLTGPIPSSLTKLTRLVSLTISNTRVSGAIPSFLCNLPALVNLDLSGNRHTGSIPGCFRNHFDYFALRDNRLTGKIPPSLSDIDFWEVTLAGNRLTGDASFLFGEKKRADLIDLSRNRLDFDLSTVSFPLRLTQLDVSHNKIHGSISKQVSKLGMLQAFNVSYNELCGPIPTAGFIKQFDQSSYLHNKCLCGGPLAPCRAAAMI